jgi:hypothetical protein
MSQLLQLWRQGLLQQQAQLSSRMMSRANSSSSSSMPKRLSTQLTTSSNSMPSMAVGLNSSMALMLVVRRVQLKILLQLRTCNSISKHTVYSNMLDMRSFALSICRAPALLGRSVPTHTAKLLTLQQAVAVLTMHKVLLEAAAVLVVLLAAHVLSAPAIRRSSANAISQTPARRAIPAHLRTA